MKTNSSALRGLWLAVIVLSGLTVAVLAGAMFWMISGSITAGFTAGGATFVGVTSLGMAMRKFLTEATVS